MIRVFLALDISKEVQKKLGELIQTLRFQTKGVKWVEPQNFHVTLKFFGDIDETKQLPLIEKTIENRIGSLKPTPLTCAGIGAFPQWHTPKVIWAGLNGESEALIHFQNELESDFEGMGFPKEEREFKMHLTLGRVRFKPRESGWIHTLENLKEKEFGQTVVDHVTLYKSQLTKEGAIYTAVKEFKFNMSLRA